MKKEIKIEDFIDSNELKSMTKIERDIYENVYQLNKNKLQEYTDLFELLEKIKNDISASENY